jgi:hypothetical protein
VHTAGTVLVASAFSIAQLVIGRLILGVGVGLATQATPLYLSEMAPYNLRGGLNILFQLAVTIGKHSTFESALKVQHCVRHGTCVVPISLDLKWLHDMCLLLLLAVIRVWDFCWWHEGSDTGPLQGTTIVCQTSHWVHWVHRTQLDMMHARPSQSLDGSHWQPRHRHKLLSLVGVPSAATLQVSLWPSSSTMARSTSTPGAGA